MLIQVTDITGGQRSIFIIQTDSIVKIVPGLYRLEFSNGDTVSLSEADYKDLIGRLIPRKRAEKDNSGLYDLLNRLNTLTGGKKAVILTAKRKNQIEFLMSKRGGSFTEEMLETAAKNIGDDKFLQGENDNNKRYGDIDYLLRPDKAAKYFEIAPAKKERRMF